MNVSRVVVPLLISVLTLSALVLALWIVSLVDSGASARVLEPIVIGREERPGLDGDGGNTVDATSSTTTTTGVGSHSVFSSVETVEQPIHMRTMGGSMERAPSANPPSTSSQRPPATSPPPTHGDGENGDGAMERSGMAVSYTHLRAHETKANLVCRLLLENKKKTTTTI